MKQKISELFMLVEESEESLNASHKMRFFILKQIVNIVVAFIYLDHLWEKQDSINRGICR